PATAPMNWRRVDMSGLPVRGLVYGLSRGACCCEVGAQLAEDARCPTSSQSRTIAVRPPENACMTEHLLPTTVVGSYPQPDWLVDRALLKTMVPRVRE